MFIHEAWILGHLLINRWTDLRTRQVSVFSVILLGAGGINIFRDERTLEDVIVSVSIGGLIFVLGLVSEESIGAGDGLFIIALGLNMKWELLLELLVKAFVLCVIYMAVRMLRCRTEERLSVPFIPFLLAAGLCCVF